MAPATTKEPLRVIVIGAGMSGLACARELQHRRYNVLILEARSRLGGRTWGADVYTSDTETCTVDLGGALIHGTIGNPLSQLCVQLGVETTENMEHCLLLDTNGWPVDPKQDEKVTSLFNQALEETFQEIAKRTADGNDLGTRSGGPTQACKSQTSGEAGSFSNQNRHIPSHADGPAPDEENNNFGHLFDRIAEKICGSTLMESPLWIWHQANLELSGGVGFEHLGYTWNDDEAYGFEGAHVALRHSFRTIVEALAEPLNVVYDCPVTGIQLCYDGMSAQVERTDLGPQPEPSPRKRQVVPPSAPSRKSRRLQGETAEVRRSSRTPKPAHSFTVESHVPLSYENANLTHPVSSKKTGPPKVRVIVQNGSILEADAVVCTLPLGVLKSSSIKFEPPLPEPKQQAIEKMGCGLLNKCVLSFSDVFWQDSDFLGVAGEDSPFLILNGHKVTGKPILIFMFGGQSAWDVDQDWNDEELVEECMTVLRKVSKTPPPVPLDYVVTRWGQDAYAKMSYSYVKPGVDGSQAHKALGDPIMSKEGKPVILFAGEHTTPFHPSTIHGAFLSGIREAYRLDLALEPKLNNGVVFNPDNLYQKTFPLRKAKDTTTPSQAVIEGASGRISKLAYGDEAASGRRRRHGVMTLRKKKHVTPSAMSPVRHSSRTQQAQEQEHLQPSRKSQRKHKSPTPYHTSDDEDDNGEARPEPSRLATPQDERTLGRLIYAYQAWQVIQTKVLPLFGSTKKPHALRQRYQQIRKSARRNDTKLLLADWKVGNTKEITVPTAKERVCEGARQSSRVQVSRSPLDV